jgi:RNA polymerase sigma-70 factor (ECF subfamily)
MTSLLELIDRARSGESSALGELLEKHREVLRILAERDLGERLRRRVDASDIVQQTFLIAHCNFDQFRGESDSQLAAWLRQILNQNVQEAVRRHVHTQHRTVTQEVSLQSAGTTSLPLDPVANDPTPSHLVARREAASELLTALESLPDDQRQVVQFKHLDCWSVAQIADSLGKSEAAVAGLLRRGVVALREKLHET